MRKMGLSATTYAANVLSSPDSPTVPLRVRATGWSTGSAVIDTEPLQQQLRGVFRVLRGRGQPVHCVHMAVGHGAAAAADSSPQLDFAYLDAAGTLLTVEEKDIKVRRTKFYRNPPVSGRAATKRQHAVSQYVLTFHVRCRPMARRVHTAAQGGHSLPSLRTTLEGCWTSCPTSGTSTSCMCQASPRILRFKQSDLEDLCMMPSHSMMPSDSPTIGPANEAR